MDAGRLLCWERDAPASFVGGFRFHHRITLALQLSDLPAHRFQPSKRTLDLGLRVCREWLTESSPQYSQTTTSVAKQWVVIAHAKRRQNSSNPVGQTDALRDEFGPFAKAVTLS